MFRVSRWLPALACSFLLTTPVLPAQQPASPPAAPALAPADRDVQALLEKLTAASELIARNSNSPQVWRHQLAQAEVLLQLAARTQGKERDNWLHLAVDSHYSAAVQCPENEPAAYHRLAQLPAEIARAFPGSTAATYAIRQQIQVDHLRALNKGGEDPDKVQQRLRDRLLAFAREVPQAPEAAKAVLDAGEISEGLGKTNEARDCYRYLMEHFAGNPLARKAGGSLRRLGLDGETIHFELPLLYSAGDPPYNLDQERGRIVIVYFWSSASTGAGEDLRALKDLSSRYRAHGLQIVQVNLDADPAKGRAFLAGRLTAGIHLYQGGGLEGAVAERYGIQSLPQVFVVGKEGKLLQHSRPVSQVESTVSRHLTPGR
jgi:hypothetical protein